MRKLTLLCFLVTSLGGVAMAAPERYMPQESSRSMPQEFSRSMPQEFSRSMPQEPSRSMPRSGPISGPHGGPNGAPHGSAQAVTRSSRAEGRRIAGRYPQGLHHVHGTEICDAVVDMPIIDAFARVPQLDGTLLDIPFSIDGNALGDIDSLNGALLVGFEQVLNQEGAVQGRTVAALLAHGAVLGNRDGENHESIYQFDMDAELRIVRQAYLLQTKSAHR